MEDKKGKKKLNFTPPVRPTAPVRQSAPSRPAVSSRNTPTASPFNGNGINGLVEKTAVLSTKTTSPASASSQPSDVKIINAPFSATENTIRELLAGYQVKNVSIKRGKGFCFVSLASNSEARRAFGQFNGKDFLGRKIAVQIVPPKK